MKTKTRQTIDGKQAEAIINVMEQCGHNYTQPYGEKKTIGEILALYKAAPELLAALKMQASWKMRDGSLCACPAGRNEYEPKGKMPTFHTTSCEMLRAAIAKAEGRKVSK